MSYPPNINCAQFLALEVLPLVWKQRPSTNLLISGTSPSKEVMALHNDKVVVGGWVADIRESFVDIFDAPGV